MPTRVFVDANVLFSSTLRDWLFLLRNETHGSMLTVCTSEDVIAETMYSIRREIPTMSGARLTRIHDLISTQVDDRVTDYAIFGASPVADPHDAHVHAAAVASEVDILLTQDQGFLGISEHALYALPYEVHSPDTFFVLVDDSDERAVRRAVEYQFRYHARRGKDFSLSERLRTAKCVAFAERVALHVQEFVNEGSPKP